MSKTTVSRILRDSNDKGSTYQPTVEIVVATALAFQLDRAGWERLMDAAFPERLIWFEAMDKHLSVNETNQRLYDVGLPMLCNTKED